MSAPVPRYQGGAPALRWGLAMAGVGLLASGIGFAVDLPEAAWSWLFAFDFWMGLSVGALLLLGALHATRARWSVPFRRVLEAMALSSALLIPLFVPVALSLDTLFLWHALPPGLRPEDLERLHHKAAYLNGPFFVARAVCYLLIWTVTALLLERWSRRQDATALARYGRWQYRLGGASLVFAGLALSFAALDWVMSVDPLWISTVFGVYFFAGAFQAALAVLCVVAAAGQRGALFAGLLRPSHFHTLGKLLLALVAFWAYIAFCQFMLVWIADEPEEVPWFVARTAGGWLPVAWTLALGRFVLPFFVLLSRSLKLLPRALAALAGWLVLTQVVDVYWMLLPTHHAGHPVFHWTQPAALLGMGGLFVAFVAWRLRGGYPLPVGDPQLLPSLNEAP